MIRIWHDSAMKWLLLWLCFTMMNTGVLLGVFIWRQASRHQNLPPSPAGFVLILWLAVAFYLAFGNVRMRCHRIEMTLPISTRVLWRRHLAAVFVAGSIVLAGSFAMLALHAALIFNVGRHQVLVVPYLALIGPLLCGLLLAASLVTSVEPGLWKLGSSKSYWARVAGAVVGIPVILAGLAQWPWASTGICLVLAAAIAYRTQRSIPATFRLVPSAAAAAATRVSVAASTDYRVSRWQVYRTLFNVLHTAPPWKQFTPWMVYSFVALMGFLLSGGLDRWRDVTDVRILYLPFGSYMLFAGIGVLSYNLYRLDSLPVPRRTILAVLTVPGLLFYCLGYAVGWYAWNSNPESSSLVEYRVRQAHVEIDLHEGEGARPKEFRTMTWVEVDPGFMGMSLSGEPPVLTSPWGESHQAWHEELFRGSSAIYYNPYNTAEEASPDFEALMLSRAIQDVYGEAISPDELRDRYFVIEGDRLVGLRELDKSDEPNLQGKPDGIRLLDDYPELVPSTRRPETPVYMILVLVPWFLLTALFLHAFKATHSNKYIRGVYWAGLAIPMLGMLSQVFLDLFGLFSPAAGRGYLEILIRSLGESPLTWATTWIVAIAMILATYRLALRCFERAEIPVSPINCSMVDWGKMD